MRFIYLSMLFMFVFAVVFVSAAKPIEAGIPAHAKEIAPGHFYTGKFVEKGRTVEGYAFITYGKSFAKPADVCGDGKCSVDERKSGSCPADCTPDDPVNPPSDNQTLDTSGDSYSVGNAYCYNFTGAKWFNVEPYYIDTKNDEGLNPDVIIEALEYSISEWEDATDGVMGNNMGVNVVGAANEASRLRPGKYNNKNEVALGNVNTPGAIAVTYYWYYTDTGAMAEWDQVYDTVDFNWAFDGSPDKMDFLSIAIHEMGHTFGMLDLYYPACSLQTMYGYGSEGETDSRTLALGDITGINILY
ncbi:MAG: matrixin family metalloprotease [archaeon]